MPSKRRTKPNPSDILDCFGDSTEIDSKFNFGLPGEVPGERSTIACISIGDSSIRMLPDARDGLTPLQRRIIYTMYEYKLVPPKRTNSARVVKGVFAKYHPEFPSPIYNALVRMANPMVCRYPLLSPKGNFGDLDNGAASSAYTDVGLSAIALQCLKELDFETVDFVDSIDGQNKEPCLLPSTLPILLMNGVGHTKFDDKRIPRIPCHNFAELCDAILAKIDNPDLTSKELLRWCNGPDFPEGGTIVNGSDLAELYESGTGTLVMRGEAQIELLPRDNSRHVIAVTSLPFMIGPEFFENELRNLVRADEIAGISDISNDTTRHGVRVMIELKSNVNPPKLLEELLHFTSLQIEIPVNMLVMVHFSRRNAAGVNYAPRIASLAELIQCYIDYQSELVTNRIRFHLRNVYMLLPEIHELSKSESVRDIFSQNATTQLCVQKLTRILGISQDKAQVLALYNSFGSPTQERLAAASNSLGAYSSPRDAAVAYERILQTNSEILGIVKSQVLTLRNTFADRRRTKICDD